MTPEEVYEIWESNSDAKMYVALKYQYDLMSEEIKNATIDINDDKKGGAFERFTTWILKSGEISASLKKLRASITDEDLNKANQEFTMEGLHANHRPAKGLKRSRFTLNPDIRL
jgi:hypothetical protein